MPLRFLIISLFLAVLHPTWLYAQTPNFFPKADYVGRFVCAQCHEERFVQHSTSPHANSWKPTEFLDGVEGLPLTAREGGHSFSVEKTNGRWVYRLKLPDRPEQDVNIHSIIGGDRFGHSFVLEVAHAGNHQLARTSLVEARYMLDEAGERLKLSPGFPRHTPDTFEMATGRVMSPQFADRCLGCHGGPVDSELASEGGPSLPFLDTGISCERCHGPGSAHIEAVSRKAKDLRIVHPGKLTNQDLLAICAQCHTGFFPLVRPRPDDVLIASQVIAMTSSKCFVQSAGGFSCLSCHDPHTGAHKDQPEYRQTCLDCHNSEKAENVPCPVQPSGDCIPCHMPISVQPGEFTLTDHWIRVIRRFE